MEPASNNRWKMGEKCELVHESFVLDTVPIISPCDSRMRFYNLDNHDEIRVEFKEYCETYW